MFSVDQYRAARTATAVVDRSARGKIALRGADRKSFLHALLTNDIAPLQPGTGTYSAYLTPQGRMITDMRLAETGDHLLLDVEPSIAAGLASRLESLIFSEDVQVRDVTAELGETGVYGPAARSSIAHATGISVDGLIHDYDNLTASGFTVVRDDSLGVTGFDIYSSVQDVESLRSSLTQTGAIETDEAVWEALRIEAGRPRFGVDMNSDTIPLEAGIEDRAISMTKGCYVGQEVIVRVLHRGHGRVAKRLVGLVMERGSTVPGDKVVSGDIELGAVTSSAESPLMRTSIALAYVAREHAVVGTRLSVKSAGGELPATVAALPFTPL